MLRVYCWMLADAMRCGEELLAAAVSEEKRCSLTRYRRREDAMRTLAAEVLVRSVLASEYGMANDDIAFGRTAHGKPYIIGRSDVHFNVSHSGGLIAAVFASTAVGIDVERERPVDLAVAERFFHPLEAEALRSCGEERRPALFTDIWTRKESVLKQCGAGLSAPLDSFSVLATGGEWEGKLVAPGGGMVAVRPVNLANGYACAVCTGEELSEHEMDVSRLEAEQILERIGGWKR